MGKIRSLWWAFDYLCGRFLPDVVKITNNLMKKDSKLPSFVLESSWEVCNKVGGIYTVLSTKAKTMQSLMPDKVVFVGPDVWRGKHNPLFIEDPTLWPSWTKKLAQDGLRIRSGRWIIPGHPLVILVDFSPLFERRNEFYAEAWNHYCVDSLHGYGDYDEANMFSMAAGMVVERFYHEFLEHDSRVVYHVHEWMTCMGALYVQHRVPQIATIFTTHATSIGRSIAGNGKPLYKYLWAYNGSQMARELNIEAKHSLERETAHHIDCFTTVSDVTAKECHELLEKKCDAVLMNGFEADFVPQGAKLHATRRKARENILKVANALTGAEFAKDTMIVATSGRYEFKNKGIDVFIQAMHQCTDKMRGTGRQMLALIQVPGWVAGPRADLQARLLSRQTYDTPLDNPIVTHRLHNDSTDQVCTMLRNLGINNSPESPVKVIFTPCYLDGYDGVFNFPYYNLLVGTDVAVYPSYYEPWGYTPLEAVAFHVPCITTSLSGFGMWVERLKGANSRLRSGVEVINRNDDNQHYTAEQICETLCKYAPLSAKQKNAARRAAGELAGKALWKNFYIHYLQAYEIAFSHAQARLAAQSESFS